MSDLETGLSPDNYQQLRKHEEEHEVKEEVHFQQQKLLDSPPFIPPLQSKPLAQHSKRSSQQVKALVYKNLQLQSRQIGTNITQVIAKISETTPLYM